MNAQCFDKEVHLVALSDPEMKSIATNMQSYTASTVPQPILEMWHEDFAKCVVGVLGTI